MLAIQHHPNGCLGQYEQHRCGQSHSVEVDRADHEVLSSLRWGCGAIVPGHRTPAGPADGVLAPRLPVGLFQVFGQELFHALRKVRPCLR